jgi:hypothetical protein
VEPNFDANAMTEIAFRRDRSDSFPASELAEEYEKMREVALGGQTEGRVQTEAETELLERLRGQITALAEGLEQGEILLVENEQGVDYPKVRDRKQGIIEDGENRLIFHWRVDPPLRIGVYRRRAS